ncbi:alanine acetyltransferase [Skermanella stibiiresistens SB22]|uniref:Alanine acetyltransferase n=1 Tax=Skermanella stibiiresistens SB22 TaxID=1385369 RepID=W9H6J6_9PROT|nr:GNAT family N-acetyltransferase [Skermanella stibiiresistens]EWY40416.1 alanine acetyltransferase [Skermanella stibiiresistens SB22]
MKVRPAGLPDLEILETLHSRCFPDEPWSAAAFGRLLETMGVFVFLAATDPKDRPGDSQADGASLPVGFVMVRVAAGEAEIITLGVEPATRGRGAGALLLRAALEMARTAGAEAMFLEVAEDNAAAKRLYRHHEFAEIGRRPNYYRRIDGFISALVMKLELFQVNTNQS